MERNMKSLKEMANYINVTIDKEFALELIPIVELTMTHTDTIKKIAKSELNFIEKFYIKLCDKKQIETKLYQKIMEKGINLTRYKILKLLEVLHDIMTEDSVSWNNRWKIKSYYKIKYDEIKTDILGVESFVLEPKPEYRQKQKENERRMEYNLKRKKICQKWRNSHLNFYKKILKIVNN